MATGIGFGAIVAAVEQTWNLSVAVVPILFVVLFIYYLSQQRDTAGLVELVISSQRDVMLVFTPYLVAGFVTGGVVNMMLAGDGILPGAVVVALALGAAILNRKTPEPTRFEPERPGDVIHLFWVLVLIGSILTTLLMLVTVSTDAATGTPLQVVKSVLAVVFYATMFWEL